MKKKIVYILGGFIVLVLIILISIPFFIDVDKYRPLVIKEINKNIKGHVDIGKLSLNLIGKIKIKVDGVTVQEFSNKEILSVQDAQLIIPWSSLLLGSPEIIFNMKQPTISVVKNIKGEINLLSLVSSENVKVKTNSNESNQSYKSQEIQTEKGINKKPDSIALPALVYRSKISLRLENAQLSYLDEKTGAINRVRDLNIYLKDLSLNRPIEYKIWADLSLKQENATLEGRFQTEGNIAVQVSESGIQKLGVAANIDADQLSIKMPGIFEKEIGSKMFLDLDANYEGNVVVVKKLILNFGEIKFEAYAEVENKGSSDFGQKISGKFNTNIVRLSELKKMLPIMNQFVENGEFTLNGNLEGTTKKPQYSAFFRLKDVFLKNEYFKVNPKLNLSFKLQTDEINQILLTLEAPKTDLTIKGNLLSFEKPALFLSISSKKINLDEWVNFPEQKKHAFFSVIQKAYAEEGKVSENMDEMVYKMTQNPIMKNLKVKTSVSLDEIIAKGVVVKNLSALARVEDMVKTVENFKFKIFDGFFNSNMKINFNSKISTYFFDFSLQGFDMNQAVKSQLELFKDTAYGKLSMSLNGRGSSFNPDLAKKNLEASGKIKILDAKFSSIDVGKMVSEGINGALDKVGGKIPGLKGKQIKKIPSRASEFESIDSRLIIKNGQAQLPDFFAKAKKGSGVDLKGETTVNLLNDDLFAKWWVIDRQNLTNARDVNVDQSGVSINHILAEGNDPVQFPVTVKCKISKPCYEYKEVPEHFLKVVTSNLKGAVKKQVQSKAKEAVKSQAQDAAKKLFKKFGF